MVIKTALILLFLAMPVSAQTGLADAWVQHGDIIVYEPHGKDTTRYYIKEIKQKCDTTYVAIGGHDCTDCPKCGTPPITFWPDIKCIDDTIWADKVQVWLTPIQLEELMRIIERLKL